MQSFFLYPSVGEDGVTLLNQDGFDHSCVHYSQERLPTVVQPCDAMANCSDAVQAWNIACNMNDMM